MTFSLSHVEDDRVSLLDSDQRSDIQENAKLETEFQVDFYLQ